MSDLTLVPEPVQSLVNRYLEYAVTELTSQGKPRAPPTMSSYRRALEGFVAAVVKSGLPLTELPENFMETQWLPTQESVFRQPVQLRIRAIAVKQFIKWLFLTNVPCAPLISLNLPTPPPKPKMKKEPHMSDQSHLGDASLADPVPATQTYAPPQPQYAPPQPVMQTAVPVPQPRQQPQPLAKPVARVNPLASMFPTEQVYKLRVRRERENADPAFVGDFAAERVKQVGAVEPFLSKFVVPQMLALGITGDVTFYVSTVDSGNRESEQKVFTISCVPTAAAPTQTIVNGAPTQAPSTQQEIADTLAFHRRAQEELEERMDKKFGAQQPAPAVERVVVGGNSEVAELRQAVSQLASNMERMMERMERSSSRDSYEPPAPVAATTPQLDMLKVIEAVGEMSKRNAPAPAAVMGPVETMAMMAQMKTLFAPQNIQVENPLEDDMRELRREMKEQKKDDISDMVTKFGAIKQLFQLVGGDQSAPKPTLGSALGGLLMKIIENPTPLAEAAERVLNAAKGVSGSQQQSAQQQPQLPPQVVAATRALLGATEPGALVVAAHEWITLLSNLKGFEKPMQRISEFLRERKVNELGLYLQQVLKALGAEASAEKCATMSRDLISQLPGIKPEQLESAAEEAEEDGEGDEEGEADEQAPADMTIRVGGAQDEQQEGDDEAADDGAEGGEEEAHAELLGDSGEEEAEHADAAEADGDADAEAGADDEAAADEASLSEEAPSEEELEQATETKSQRRKRVKAEKAAEATPMRLGLREIAKPVARG